MAKNDRTIERTCKHCNKTFLAKKKDMRHAEKHGLSPRGIFCNRKCSMQFYSNQCSTTVDCTSCGKQYRKLTSRIPESGKNFCSNQCSTIRDRSYRSELSLFKWLARSSRRSDKYRSKGSSNLTAEHLKEVFEAQDGICPITGWKLNLPVCKNDDYYIANPLSPNSLSLDRIDNSIGHVNGNVRFVSVMANYARNRFNDEDLKSFIKAAYNHL